MGSSIVGHLTCAQLARRTHDANHVQDEIVRPATLLLRTLGLDTWTRLLGATASDMDKPCAGLLMPYEWKWQYGTVLKEGILAGRTEDDHTLAVLPHVKQQMRSIVLLDAVRFAKSWHENNPYRELKTIIMNDTESPANWRLAAVAYFLERDIWCRRTPVVSRAIPAAGDGTPLDSIAWQSQWLSAILLYHLHASFATLPGVDGKKPIVASIDPLAGPSVASITFPDDTETQGRATGNYPHLIWRSTRVRVPGSPARSPLVSGDALGWGDLGYFMRVFGTLVSVDLTTSATFHLKGDYMHIGTGLGAPTEEATWARLKSFKATPPEALLFSLKAMLQAENCLLGKRTRAINSVVPILADYEQVCRILDASRGPLLARFFGSFVGLGRLFGISLPTDANTLPDNIGLEGDKLESRLSSLQPGSLWTLLSKTLEALVDPVGTVKAGSVAPKSKAEALRKRYASRNTDSTTDVSLFLVNDSFRVAFPDTFDTTILAEPSLAISQVIQTVTLPILTGILATRTKRWMRPGEGLGRYRMVQVSGNGDETHLELPFNVTTGPDVSATTALPAPPLPTGDAKADEKARKGWEKETLESEHRRSSRTVFLSHLSRMAGSKKGVDDFLAYDWSRRGSSYASPDILLHPDILTRATFLEHVQSDLDNPWASIGEWLEFVVWAFDSANGATWTLAVNKGQEMVEAMERNMRSRMSYDLRNDSLMDILRRDDTYAPDGQQMARPEFSGHVYFSAHFKDLLRLGMLFVRREFGHQVTQEQLTAILDYPDLATSFALYLSAVEAARELVGTNVYKTDMNHRFQGGVSLQNGEIALRTGIADFLSQRPAKARRPPRKRARRDKPLWKGWIKS